jgi:serine/threonine protein phosphatase PrpC
MQRETWAHSERGLVRKSNQDALGVFPDLGLFILADGMGGG